MPVQKPLYARGSMVLRTIAGMVEARDFIGEE
jgi:hypothetical protein